MASTNPLVEYWTYLAIDIVVVAGRIAARWQTVGFRDLAPDDYLMVVAIVSTSSFFDVTLGCGKLWSVPSSTDRESSR